jgi:hypothetical protein
VGRGRDRRAVDDLGTFTFDRATMIRKDLASTSNDDLAP